MTKRDAINLIYLINTATDPAIRRQARDLFYQHWTLDDYARWHQEAMGGEPRQRAPRTVDVRLSTEDQQRENALRMFHRWQTTKRQRDYKAFLTYVFDRITDHDLQMEIMREITAESLRE